MPSPPRLYSVNCPSIFMLNNKIKRMQHPTLSPTGFIAIYSFMLAVVAAIWPLRAYRWLRRNLRQTARLEGKGWKRTFLIPLRWAFEFWLWLVWFLLLAILGKD